MRLAVLERNLEPTGFIGYLRKLGDDPNTPEYLELTNVLEKMLRRRIEELEAVEKSEEIDPFA